MSNSLTMPRTLVILRIGCAVVIACIPTHAAEDKTGDKRGPYKKRSADEHAGGRTNHAEELDSAATKLGRLAGRAFADLKRRAKEP